MTRLASTAASWLQCSPIGTCARWSSAARKNLWRKAWAKERSGSSPRTFHPGCTSARPSGLRSAGVRQQGTHAGTQGPQILRSGAGPRAQVLTAARHHKCCWARPTTVYAQRQTGLARMVEGRRLIFSHKMVNAVPPSAPGRRGDGVWTTPRIGGCARHAAPRPRAVRQPPGRLHNGLPAPVLISDVEQRMTTGSLIAS